MSRYSDLEPYLKWRYLGIKEEGYEPLEFSIEKIKRGERDVKLGRTVSMKEIKRREDLGLPENTCPTMPPNGKSREGMEDREFPLLDEDS